MADPRRSATAEHGFTLAEMLVALSILTVGVTTLLAALGESMATRRTTDSLLLAEHVVEDFVHRTVSTGLRLKPDAASPFDLELQVPEPQPVEGIPGGTVTGVVETDEARPDVLLLRVRVSWLERGETFTEEFLRVVPRQLPLSARVQTFRKEHDLSR